MIQQQPLDLPAPRLDTLPPKLARSMARAAARHFYQYDAAARRLAIHEPEAADGARVCLLDGDPRHPATIYQAEAICKALDSLARRLPDLLDH